MNSRLQRARWVLLTVAVALTGLGAPVTEGTGPAGASTRAPAQTPGVPSSFYEAAGPHRVTSVQGGPNCTLYYPTDLGAGGPQLPVLIWGNGTGVTPAPYDFALRHLASWGFAVGAANTTQSGSGQEMLACGRFLIDQGRNPSSPFYGRIDETKVGAAGHSQGGGGAIAAGQDPLVDATIPIQPGPQGSVAGLRGPSLFVAGQVDWIVPSFYVRLRYWGAGQVPAVFAELRGADHFFPEATRPRVVGVITAWFRFHLAGDERARGIFFGPTSSCPICNDTAAWSSVDRNARALAVPGSA